MVLQRNHTFLADTAILCLVRGVYKSRNYYTTERRKNVVTHNQIDFRNAKETERHNRAMEELTGQSQGETVRHNLAMESETNRANLASEALKSSVNTETNRANLARESLTHESNVLNYSVGQQQIGLGYKQLNESTRHNKNAEKLGYFNYQETNRHNVEQESTNALNALTNVSDSTSRKKQAQAAIINAGVNQDLAPSQKFGNYSKPLGDLGKFVGSLTTKSTSSGKKIRKGVNSK